jgi:hypothetical protein
MDSDFDPHHQPESLAVLWVTASSRQRIGARLCTLWVVVLAESQGDRRPWPSARHAALELHAWACRPGDPVAPSAPLARLEAAASKVGPGLSRRVIEIAVDSCRLEAARRSGREHDSSAGMEAQLALGSYVAVAACGAMPPAVAMRHVVDAAMDGEPEAVREVAASLLADWEGDLRSLVAASRRLA